jgi:cation:H+ antiporter
MVWIEFAICSVLMIAFAYNLCREGVIISERTHIEEGIIGMIFLAIATSFPEIVVGVASTASAQTVGLGYGDLVGSVIVNSMLLFFIDYSIGRGRLLARISRMNRLTAFFLLAVAAVLLIAGVLRKNYAIPSFGPIGPESAVIAGIYLVFLKKLKKGGIPAHEAIYHSKKEPFWEVWAKFGFFLVMVMILGTWMAGIGEKIVNVTGLSQTFTGTLLLGLTTSFPEIIVTVVAMKAASFDMAVGNVLGSNIFDLCIVSFLDVLTKKPILGMITEGQVIATAIAVLISVITVSALAVKRDSPRRVSLDTGLIFAVGLSGFVILYFVK